MIDWLDSVAHLPPAARLAAGAVVLIVFTLALRLGLRRRGGALLALFLAALMALGGAFAVFLIAPGPGAAQLLGAQLITLTFPAPHLVAFGGATGWLVIRLRSARAAQMTPEAAE